MIKAAIFMGDPRYINGLSYNVGSCRANGVCLSLHCFAAPIPLTHNIYQFAPRPAGFQCPSASKIQSYCDSADPYCCNGNNANTHQSYGNVYGQAALNFIKGKLA